MMKTILKLSEPSFTLDVKESAQYLEEQIGLKLSITDFYKLVLNRALVISVKLFNPTLAEQGRYFPFSKEDYLLRKNNKSKKLKRYWGWVDTDQIFFDRAKKQHFTFGKKKTKITGVWDLSMLGNEALHLEGLRIKAAGNTNPIVIEHGHIFLKKGNKLCKLLSSTTDYSALKDVSHELVFKKKNLDKFVEFVKKNPSKNKPVKENVLQANTMRSLKIIISPFLKKHGIVLGQPNSKSRLSELVSLSGLTLSEEVLKKCSDLLITESCSKEMLQSGKEEDLLIILRGLLHQENYDSRRELFEAGLKVIDTFSKGHETLQNRTIKEYFKKAMSLDES